MRRGRQIAIASVATLLLLWFGGYFRRRGHTPVAMASSSNVELSSHSAPAALAPKSPSAAALPHHGDAATAPLHPMANAWTAVDVSAAKPSGRDEAGSFVFRAQWCLLGGRQRQPIECFNEASRSWVKTRSTTDDLHHVQPVVFDNKVYVPNQSIGL